MQYPGSGVLVLRDEVIEGRHPRASELLFVAEISDASLRFDLDVKAKLYARSNVPEYWVVDLVNRRIVTHRDPANGVYRDIRAFGEAESVSTAGHPETKVPVSELLLVASAAQ
jgi:Uma2 family endonuclease